MEAFEQSLLQLDLNWISFLGISGFLFLVIVARYFIFVGLAEFLIKKYSTQWIKLHEQNFDPSQKFKEIKWSLISSMIFAFSGYLMWLGIKLGISKIYFNGTDRGVFWLFLSFVILSMIHELYFYFTHRLMHLNGFYQRVHSVHHESKIVSPWASFSFHPFETLVHALFLPILCLGLPLHPFVVLGYLIWMTLTAISNHLGFEVIRSTWLRRHFISGEHHTLHHLKYRYHYGLYFTWLDRLMGTEFKSKS